MKENYVSQGHLIAKWPKGLTVWMPVHLSLYSLSKDSEAPVGSGSRILAFSH